MTADRFSPTPFRPAWWIRNPHAQTLAGKLFRPKHAPTLERERLELPDGDFLDLEWSTDPAPDAPVCLVLHGLEGNAKRPYALLLYRALLEHGVRPVGLHFRSCSGEMNRTARFYHSGETTDLAFVARTLRTRYPDRPCSAVGFSLGGNVLLKYLGELADEGPCAFRSAVAISVPFDLSAGTRALEESWMGRNVYTRYFIRSLLNKAERKRALLADSIEIERLRRSRSLREFDDVATAPLHGFRDAEDYYARSSSKGFLPHIRVPTLLIQALDDPFLPPEALPRAEIDGNPRLHRAFTPRGGHVGFVAGSVPWRTRFWAEEEAARFVAHVSGNGSTPPVA